MRHVIRLDAAAKVDIPMTILALNSRGRPLPGDRCRDEREQVAALLGGGPLADLLRSDAAIVVRSRSADTWEVQPA